MTTLPPRITAGVDTHLDVHVTAALDAHGALVDVASFETTAAGYTARLDWLRSWRRSSPGYRPIRGSCGAPISTSTRPFTISGCAPPMARARPRFVRKRRRSPQDRRATTTFRLP
jgi:hypothetical protein